MPVTLCNERETQESAGEKSRLSPIHIVLVSLATMVAPVIIGFLASSALIKGGVVHQSMLGNVPSMAGLIICVTSVPIVVTLSRKSMTAAVVLGEVCLSFACALAFLDLPLLM